MILPTASMGMSWAAQTMMEPMTLGVSADPVTTVVLSPSSLPEDGADLDGLLAAEPVGQRSGNEGAEPGAAGHGSRDAALHIGARADAQPLRRVALTVSACQSAAGGQSEKGWRERTSWLNWHRYGWVEMMALMDEMSKPNRPPPMTATAAMR